MNISRISYLFPAGRYDNPTQRGRLVEVMAAVCLAVKARASAREHAVPLTYEINAVPIDEVVPLLAIHPEGRHTIVTVIETIRELKNEGYLADDDDRFEVIALTDLLFRAIAEEWAYAKGVRPHRVAGEKIYARTVDQARAIQSVRSQLNAQ